MPPQMPAIHLLERERVSLSCAIINLFSLFVEIGPHELGRPLLHEHLCLSVGKGMLNISTLQYIVP